MQTDYENESNTPSIYVEMLGPPIDKVTLQDLHATFIREPRHDAWAFDVESAIAQKIVDMEIAKWAVVEHIERVLRKIKDSRPASFGRKQLLAWMYTQWLVVTLSGLL